MLDADGQNMHLTSEAEAVCAGLVLLGAVPTDGYRSRIRQAQAMAVNTLKERGWIGRVYKQGKPFQILVDVHPEWNTVAALSQGLFTFMSEHPDVVDGLSHHLVCPCPCFDLDPASVNASVRERIEAYQREGLITKVLWKEGNLVRCHVEVADLPDNKGLV